MTARLTEVQINIAMDILRAGKCELSKDSTPDYVKAAAFVFDSGIMHSPADTALKALRALQSQEAGNEG